ncbi:MAG: hypothetical protein NZT92_01720 [Abditibacteriales bacterium]|nr:hypothetical protein [Abditibacteriales bacterium]MDW8364446.1 hypothetical protein [Abditibacteriales bacterium]
MSEQQDKIKPEVPRLVRMLVSISKMAKDASLTGTLREGKSMAIRQYNAVLARLKELGVISGDLFAPVAESASFDEVGVAAAQLADFLREDDEEYRRAWRHGGVLEASPKHIKIVGFPGNISDLGDILREYLPDFIKQRVASAFRVELKKGSAETCTEAEPDKPSPEASTAAKHSRMEDIEQRLEDIAEQIEQVVERLSEEDLAPEAIDRLANELSQLTQRQVELARERARLRAQEQ